jgi:hypothetical protein
VRERGPGFGGELGAKVRREDERREHGGGPSPLRRPRLDAGAGTSPASQGRKGDYLGD